MSPGPGTGPGRAASATALTAIVVLAAAACSASGAAAGSHRPQAAASQSQSHSQQAAAPQSQPAVSPSSPQAAASQSPPAAASSGPSWASYLSTQPGRTCTLQGSLSAGDAGSVLSQVAQTVLSRSQTAAGTVVRYQLRTAVIPSLPVSQGGIPPTRTSQTVPYEILANGELGVVPSSYDLGGGLEVTFQGFQVYPPIADLSSGQATNSALTGYLTGTTAAARQQADQATGTGQPLRFRADFSVAGFSAGSSIQTPAGTYRNLVGVRVALTKLVALNGTPQVNQSFNAGAGLAEVVGPTRLYFARGTGLVESDSGGVTERLNGCTG